MNDIDRVMEKLLGLKPEELLAIDKAAHEATKDMRWVPNPGPQTDAYFSRADVLLYGGEPGGGKLLSLDTPIPTPTGWTTMGEVCVGDQVIDENGCPCRVINKSKIESEDTFRLTFSDGSEIIAGARHQWVTSNRTERMRRLKCNDEWRTKRRESRPSRGTGKRPDLALRNSQKNTLIDLPTSSIKTTAQIAATLYRGDGGINHSVAMANSLQLSEAELLVDPYVLGAWLGDGSKSCGHITGLDEEIFANVANYYQVTRLAVAKTRGTIGLMTHLRQLGLLNNKHIPAAYLRASHQQRLSLLHGLMDTDGHCDLRGQCEIQLTRKELIDGVMELLSSLGIKAQMREGEAKLYGRVISQKWRLKFQTELPAFKLPRKLIRQKRSVFRGTHAVRYIEKCEPIAPVAMQCIEVDSPNHMYLCGRSMIPTHNSQLGLGLAFNCHKKSLVMRRQYTDLDGLVADALKINGGREGFNGSPPPKLKLSEDHVIDFAAAARVGDEQHQMGKGRDLLFFDEATHFAESQIRFLMGWNRTEDPTQRCRVILATNPPLSAEGLWIIKMFAPWLDPTYFNPASPGDLRWVVSDENGEDKWVDGPAPIQVGGKMVRPMSRSYIPASVADNPNYARSDYQQKLDGMPEPYRSLLLGGFRTSFQDQANQVIPTKWIQLAQERWTPKPPADIPMCAIGVDCSGGGNDPMCLAPRYDGWFAKIIEIPGKDIPTESAGKFCAGVVVSNRRDQALVVVDMGGGYGGPLYEHLSDNHIEVKRYLGAEKSTRRSNDGKLHFTNKRSAALWWLREALDPSQPGGSPIALPPDPKLVADLSAPTFKPTPNGIQVESKEDVCKRLGRSTDHGDSVMMSWYEGPRQITDASEWIDRKESRKQVYAPKIILGGRAPLSARRHV